MADTSNLSKFLTDVADAIREKKGTADKIPAENFDTEIASITTGSDGVLSPVDYQICLDLAEKIAGISPPTEGNIYGIKRLRSSSDSHWTRTDDAIDLVANATHNGTEVQNDFDNLYPWSSILSFSYDHVQQAPVAYYGDEDFTFTPESDTVNIFTKIPRFWYKRWVDDSDYEYIQIADYAAEGFNESKEFAIARYLYQNSTSLPRSISGLTPLGKVTGATFRTGARNMSEYMCLFDWQALGALQLLYLVEYANYNSQSTLGQGVCTTLSTIITCGGTDSLGMKSGCVTNDQKHSVIYRGVEDIFGHQSQIIDGVNISKLQAYVCTDPTKYAFDVFSGGYTKVGYVNVESTYNSRTWITELGFDENNPLLMLPTGMITLGSTSGSTYITDSYSSYASGDEILMAGGGSGGIYSTECGLFYAGCGSSSSVSSETIGTRLLLRDDSI